MMNRPYLISVQKIWDRAPHNAMTDLIRYKERWFCAFRESDLHVYGAEGQIRLLTSRDGGVSWIPCALLKEPGFDLRDPKLSITPTGQLMLLYGATVYRNKVYESLESHVSFSEDGESWE